MGKKSSNRKAAAHGREDKKRDRLTKKQLKKERKARKHGKEYDAELLAVRAVGLSRACLCPPGVVCVRHFMGLPERLTLCAVTTAIYSRVTTLRPS